MTTYFSHWTHNMFADSPYLFDYGENNVGVDISDKPLCIDPNLGFFFVGNLEKISFVKPNEKEIFFKNALVLCTQTMGLNFQKRVENCFFRDVLFNENSKMSKLLQSSTTDQKIYKVDSASKIAFLFGLDLDYSSIFSPEEYKQLFVVLCKKAEGPRNDFELIAIELVKRGLVQVDLNMALQFGQLGWFCYTLSNYNQAGYTCEKAFEKQTLSKMIIDNYDSDEAEDDYETQSITENTTVKKYNVSFDLFRTVEDYLNKTFIDESCKRNNPDLKGFLVEELERLGVATFVQLYCSLDSGKEDEKENQCTKKAELEKKLYKIMNCNKKQTCGDKVCSLSNILETDEEKEE